MSELRIDCVKMMREIRDRIAAEEEGMTWEQKREKLNRELETSELWQQLFGHRKSPAGTDKPR